MPRHRWRSWASARLRAVADALDGRPLPGAGPVRAPVAPSPRVLSVGSPGVLDLERAPADWAARVRAAAATLNLATDTHEGVTPLPEPLLSPARSAVAREWSGQARVQPRVPVPPAVRGLLRRQRSRPRGAQQPDIEVLDEGRPAERRRPTDPADRSHGPNPPLPGHRDVAPPAGPPGPPRLVLRARQPLTPRGALPQRAHGRPAPEGHAPAAPASPATPSGGPSSSRPIHGSARAGGTPAEPDGSSGLLAPGNPSRHVPHHGTWAASRPRAALPDNGIDHTAGADAPAPARLRETVIDSPRPPLLPTTQPPPAPRGTIDADDLWPVLPPRVEGPVPTAAPTQSAMVGFLRLEQEQAAV